MHHKQVHGVVEILESTSRQDDYVTWGRLAARAVAASEAFRRYDWLKNVPVTNISGGLRGMVVSARWRAAFSILSQDEKALSQFSRVGKVMKGVELFGHIAFVAGFAANVLKSLDEIEGILGSNDPWSTKAAKLGPQATSIASRTLAGFVTSGVDLLALSLQGYCQIADAATGNRFIQVGACQRKLQSMDASINSWVDRYTDGDEIYLLVNTYVNPRISRLLEL